MERFRGFANVWTPVAYAAELRAQPLPITVAEEPIVLFRSHEGRVAALLDRCPHRGVALSLGTVKEGCVECPFHGWRFSAQGACESVPWNPEAKREQLGADPLPARELGGLLWVFTRVGVDAPHEPDVPDELTRRDVRISGETFLWNAHWTRAIENMLDDSHLAFVHERTIGRSHRPGGESRIEHQIEPRPSGWAWTTSVDGTAQGQAAEFRWPNTVLLRVPVPSGLLVIHFTAVPVTPTSVRILQLTARSILRWRVFDVAFHAFNRRVLTEDRAVVESSPSEVPAPHLERSVRTDELALLFRKRYLRELRSHPGELLHRPARRGALPLAAGANAVLDERELPAHGP